MYKFCTTESLFPPKGRKYFSDMNINYLQIKRCDEDDGKSFWFWYAHLEVAVFSVDFGLRAYRDSVCVWYSAKVMLNFIILKMLRPWHWYSNSSNSIHWCSESLMRILTGDFKNSEHTWNDAEGSGGKNKGPTDSIFLVSVIGAISLVSFMCIFAVAIHFPRRKFQKPPELY